MTMSIAKILSMVDKQNMNIVH